MYNKKREDAFSKEFLDKFEKTQKMNKDNIEQRRINALQAAKNAAEMLKTEFKATEVYLYGSLAMGNFGEYSDIDIFVKGFVGNYWRAVAKAQSIAYPIDISIACEEDCTEGLIKEVYRNGIKI
jgi:predicted nucleotidyltransferase